MIVGLFAASDHVAAKEALSVAEAVALGTGGMDVDAATPLFRTAGVSDHAILRAKIRAWHESKKEF
jgi:hypothetical protein